MTAIKLAIRNLWGAKLRTFLNIAVLSFAFVVMVFYNGLLDGWNRQGKLDMEEWEAGNGVYWSESYDPYDPYTLQDGHTPLPAERGVGERAPVLIVQGTIYPEGRMMNIQIKGIDPEQKILKLPTGALKEGEEKEGEIPAIIGKRMAKATGLRKGDYVLIRWRDKNGTFDAREGLIKEIFNCNVGTVDNNQIWIPLKKLQEMTGLENEATIIVTGKGDTPTEYEGWEFKDLIYLEREVDEIIETKKAGKTVITILLLSISLLAIFDTQVLSIFRRQKEIGTYIALGMTRNDVIKIFTIEGSMNSILALILASLYGLPLFYYISLAGIPMPQAVDEMGVAIGEKIFPYYEAGGLIISILIVIISATIVSYLPSRKIAKLNPNEALKGKIQ